MAVALKTLFDKPKRALAGARFKAWWDGAEFDEAAALAEIEAKFAADAANDTEGADDALFDAIPYDMPPRLAALALIWGEGRIRPGDATAEGLEPARVGLAGDGVLALLSPGLVAPLLAVAAAHPGKIEAFEWREESFDALRHGLTEAKLDDRVSLTRIDLEAHVFTPNHYDGLLSIDDFAYSGYPPHLAQQIMKCLKPGACAVAESYIGAASPALATAFASSFAEPQVQTHADIVRFITDAGLTLEADEDLTDEFLGFAREGFKRLGENLAKAEGLDVAVARELAWEAEAWRTRMKLLSQRRLSRRRFILRKPAGEAPGQDKNENAPAA